MAKKCAFYDVPCQLEETKRVFKWVLIGAGVLFGGLIFYTLIK